MADSKHISPFEQVQELVRTKAFVSADPGTRRSMLENFITSSAPIDLQQQFQQAKDAGPAQAIGLLNSLIVEAAKPTSGEQTQQTIEEYAPMAGAVAGGIIAAPTIVGQTVGVTAGTMFGRMIPELTRQHLTGKPGQLGEALRLGVQHDLIETPPLVAGSEIVFRGGGKLLGAATRGLSKEAAPEINAARSVLERKIPIKDAHGQTIREVDSMTGGLTLGQQAKEGGLLQTAEAVVRGSFGGKRPFRKLEAENEKNLDSFVDEIVSRYAPDKSSSELGSALEEAVYGKNGSYQTARKISHDMHQEIDRLTANASVATSEAADFIRANEKIPAMRELYKAISVEAAHGGGKAYGGKRGLEALLGMTQDGTNGLTSFANADIAQSAVGAALRELERKGELGSANLARALFAKIRTDMDQSMARLNDPNIADLYHYAKHFHSEEVFGRFQNKLILGLANELRERPGALSAKLLAPGNVDLLKAVKDAAPPAMFNDIRKSLIFTMIGRAKDPAVGNFNNVSKVSGRELMAQIKKLDEGNSGYSKILFEGADAPTLNDFQRFTAAMNEYQKKVGGDAGVYIKLAQASAVSTLAGAAVFDKTTPDMALAGSGAILLGPALAARWFTNRQALRNFSDALYGGPKSLAMRRLLNAGMAAHQQPDQRVTGQVGADPRVLEDTQDALPPPRPTPFSGSPYSGIPTPRPGRLAPQR